MPRTVALCLALALSCVARADDTPIMVRVVTPDGKPAAGTKAWVYPAFAKQDKVKEPTPRITDVAGKLFVADVPRDQGGQELFARDDSGRIGRGWLYAAWTEVEEAPQLEVMLVDTATRAGRVTTVDGKPIAGAVVTPSHYFNEEQDEEKEDGKEKGGPPEFINLPEWESTRLSVKTDADGRFKLVTPAAGYSVSYGVKAEGFAQSKWSARTGVDLDARLPMPGAVTITIVGVEAALLNNRHWTLEDTTKDSTSPGAHLNRGREGTFDGNTKLTVGGVMPGKYVLSVREDANFPGLFEKSPVIEVASSKTTEITAKFTPLASVTGKVTDKDGKAIAGAKMYLRVTDGANSAPRAQHFVTTNADGKYVGYGPAGWYSVGASAEGYTHQQDVEPVQVEIGKLHTFAPIVMTKCITFSAQIVSADGKPAASATVDTTDLTFLFIGHGKKIKADKDGKYAVPNLPPDESVAPRVRLGKAVNVVQTYDLEKVVLPVRIEVSEANATAFKGRVVDAYGKPIPLAKVALRQLIEGAGQHARTFTETTPDSTTTDVDGRYEFAGFWAGDIYRVTVTAAGYAEAKSTQVRGEAGKTHEFADVKLIRSGLSVRGVVLGSDNKPIAGAEVFSLDGPSRFSTSTAADGSFTLKGFQEGNSFVLARKAGYRLTAIAIATRDEKAVSVALARADGSPVPPPQVSPAHLAALDGLNRHVLGLIWETHATFGFGEHAVEAMGRVDPATARKWCDEEKKRTGGKTDLTPYIDREGRLKALFATAKDDPDEAISAIHAMKGGEGFGAALWVGQRMLEVDKAKALRFAEEAVVKARERDLPHRIWSLAQAGDLASRAGNVAGGKKVMVEAGELAGKLVLDENGRNTLTTGLVASTLAPHDWDRAEALLNAMKKPRDFNRYLADCAVRVARHDLAKAKQLLTRFKPDGAFYAQEGHLRVAYAIAAKQPDEAVKLVDSVEKGPYRFQGYIRLATLLTPTDRARGMKLIDTAFELLEQDLGPTTAWYLHGGRCEPAAIGAARAKEIGYPDVPQLIARCLAYRPTGEDGRIEDRDRNIVKLAAMLACVDPATARQLLAIVGPPDALLQRALTQDRDWLFALALAYPEQASQLADKLIQRAKDARGGRNGLSGTGLVELTDVLSAKDRLKELQRWLHVSQEVDEDE